VEAQVLIVRRKEKQVKRRPKHADADKPRGFTKKLIKRWIRRMIRKELARELDS